MSTSYKIKKRIATLVYLQLLVIAPTPLNAQQKISNVRVVVQDVQQDYDSIRAILEIELIGVAAASREQIYLFPVIRTDTIERKMKPIVINGNIQQKVVRRTQSLSGVTDSAYASFTARKHKQFYKKVEYSAAVPVEKWMREANVAMVQERVNCRGEVHRLSVEIIADKIQFMEMPERTTQYNLALEIPTPPREEIKIRKESGEAQIIYKVGNADINPALGNNMNELNKIRQSIENVRKVQGVKINSISITSYASPEGRWQSNLSLSERRAASLTGWIRRNYDVAGITLNAQGNGEDWEGLKAAVKRDPFLTATEQTYILGIIEDTTDSDERERRLKPYNSGRPYQYMLKELYPPLRRSAYQIEFTVPEYSIETIKEVFKTTPAMLSLYEFYLLANLYEPDSKEYREVITKASAMFPEETTNRIAMAVFSYLEDNIPEVLKYLEGLENTPEAWLYFAALHARNNELDKAEYYAQRALDAGNPAAKEYLQRLKQYREEENSYQNKVNEWKKYSF